MHSTIIHGNIVTELLTLTITNRDIYILHEEAPVVYRSNSRSTHVRHVGNINTTQFKYKDRDV
jgi:hypothetical protein